MRIFYLDDIYIGIKEKFNEADFSFDGMQNERFSFGFYERLGKVRDNKHRRDLYWYKEVNTGISIYIDERGNAYPFAGTTPNIKSFRFIKSIYELIGDGFNNSLENPWDYSLDQRELLELCNKVIMNHPEGINDTDEHINKLAPFYIKIYLKTYGNPLKTETFIIEENAKKAREKFVVIK